MAPPSRGGLVILLKRGGSSMKADYVIKNGIVVTPQSTLIGGVAVKGLRDFSIYIPEREP
jgi:hypothetical protein